MDTIMWEILAYVVTSVLGLVFSALGMFLTYYLKKKLGNEKLADMALELNDIVKNAVLYFSQTAVSTAKKNGTWNDDVAKQVKADCLAYIQNQLTSDMKSYVEKNGKDISALIESAIASGCKG